MSSTVYPRGCGWERDGSTCAVRAPLLFVHVPHLRSVCERDTNLDIMRRPSPCLRPVRPPVTTTPHSSSPYLSSFSRYHFFDEILEIPFSDKILEISLVFTHGITPAWVNHNRCFVKKMHIDVPCYARASCLYLYNANHKQEVTFFYTTTLTWPRKSLAKVNTIILISRCKRLSTCPKSRVAHTHSISQNLSHTHQLRDAHLSRHVCYNLCTHGYT